MNRLENKNKIAIVVVGYNRLNSIKRLLDSLLDAQYPSNDIPLVISIDCSGCTELYDYVRQFEWPYGEKYVIIQEIRLGLKEHIFRCGDLTEYFKAIILLEDDLFVSPFFYDYVLQAVDAYGDEDRIAEISLYKNERNGYVGLPFIEVQDGSDVFLRQAVSSWGQCWTSMMWTAFKEWYTTNDVEEKIKTADMPVVIKGWERAWSKYYYAYLLDQQKYVLYPHVSLSTNFSEAGEHGNQGNSNEQVVLMQGNFTYKMPSFEKLVRYDIYFNNESIYTWLGMSRDEIILDMYGFHELDKKKKYILTTLELPCQKVRSYGLVFRPWEMNIKNGVSGEGITLYELDEFSVAKKAQRYNKSVGQYFLRAGNHQIIRNAARANFVADIRRLIIRLKNKISRILGLRK